MSGHPFVLALFVALVLAGCASEPPAADAQAPDGIGAPGPDGQSNATADGSAPAWQVGQWWDHKWFFGPTDTVGFTVKTIVAEDAGSAFVVATDDALTASFHGAFIFPTLGEFPKGTVTATVGEMRWPWYQFPLADGATWGDRVVTRDGNGEPYEVQVTTTATAARILTAAGEEDGFAIESLVDGKLFARYDYVPAIGWMSRGEFFDPAGDGTTPQFILEMSASGTGYSGPYVVATGDLLLNHFTHVAPSSPTAPAPHATFAPGSQHTHVLVMPFAFAAAGAQTLRIVAPDGQSWETTAVADHEGNTVHASGPPDGVVFVPKVDGNWQLATAGAGAFVAGAGALVFGIAEREGTL